MEVSESEILGEIFRVFAVSFYRKFFDFMKILIAGMGNVLRGDDGFGIRVIEELSRNHKFPEEIDLYEAGIGGIGFMQELMKGYVPASNAARRASYFSHL